MDLVVQSFAIRGFITGETAPSTGRLEMVVRITSRNITKSANKYEGEMVELYESEQEKRDEEMAEHYYRQEQKGKKGWKRRLPPKSKNAEGEI